MSYEDDDDDDDIEGGGAGQLASVVNEFMESLNAPAVSVKLVSGRTVTGSLVGLVIKKKERKGEVSLSARITVETEEGNLELDCDNIGSISAK